MNMRSVSVLALCCLLWCSACVNETADDRAALNGPTHAVVGPDGLLYVGDGYYNSRIVVFSRSGQYVRSWGTKGYGRGQFNNPHGLAFLGETLLVADRDNGRIQHFSTTGTFIDEWRGEALGRPWSLAVADDGTVVAVDGGDQDPGASRSGIVCLASTGAVLCRFSSFGADPGQLNEGHSIAVSAAGDIFVVDLQNRRVQKFSRLDSCNYRVRTDWPVLPSGMEFEPLGVAVDGERVYVAQGSDGAPILVFDALTGALIERIGAGLFKRAHAVFVDTDQTLWVTDVYADRVFHLSRSGDVLLEIGG